MTAFDIFQSPNIAKHTVLRMFPYSTGIKQDQVGIFLLVGKPVSHLLEHPLDLFPIGNILLASISMDKSQRLRPPGAYFHDGLYHLYIRLLVLQAILQKFKFGQTDKPPTSLTCSQKRPTKFAGHIKLD